MALTEQDLTWRGEYQPHPTGIYRAQLDSVEVTESAPEYGSKPRLKLTFTTDAEMDTGEPFSISVYSAPGLDPRAKVRPFLIALGENLDECAAKMAQREFRLSAYIGRKVTVVVEHEPRKDGQGVRAVVKSFQPIPKKAAPRPKPNFDDDDE